MGYSYGFKLFGGGGTGGGVGTSTNTQVLFNSSGIVAGDAGLTYDAATDTLTVGGALVTGPYLGDGYLNLKNDAGTVNIQMLADSHVRLGAALAFGWSSDSAAVNPADSGLRRVSPGLVGVTSGGSNLGSLQAGNYTATALGTPTVTSPLTVNGTPGSTTYGYKAVAYLNDGTSSAASVEVTIATGPATLNGTDNITVAVPAVANMAYMNIYRTTGGTAPPKLIYSGTSPSYIDVGTEISASTPPTTNTTGRVLVGDGSVAAPSVAMSGETGTGFWRIGANIWGWGSSGAPVIGLAQSANGGSSYGSIRLGYRGWIMSGAGANSAAMDSFLQSPTTATWQIGGLPSATPVANTLIVGESGSGTDIAGANGVIQSGAGTGAGAGSTLEFKTPNAHGSDAVAQTQVSRLTISQATNATFKLSVYNDSNDTYQIGNDTNGWRALYLTRATLGSKAKALTAAAATGFVEIALTDKQAVSGDVIYEVYAADATDCQSLAGVLRYSATNKGGTVTATVSEVGTQTLAVTLGGSTLTATNDYAVAADKVTLRCNAASSLTETTLEIRYRIDSPNTNAITPL